MCSCMRALVFLVIHLLTSLEPDKRVITMPTLLIVLKSFISRTMTQWYCRLSQRWWYSGEHSCLPSSWPGFDSRPSQCCSRMWAAYCFTLKTFSALSAKAYNVRPGAFFIGLAATVCCGKTLFTQAFSSHHFIPIPSYMTLGLDTLLLHKDTQSHFKYCAECLEWR